MKGGRKGEEHLENNETQTALAARVDAPSYCEWAWYLKQKHRGTGRVLQVPPPEGQEESK